MWCISKGRKGGIYLRFMDEAIVKNHCWKTWELMPQNNWRDLRGWNVICEYLTSQRQVIGTT